MSTTAKTIGYLSVIVLSIATAFIAGYIFFSNNSNNSVLGTDTNSFSLITCKVGQSLKQSTDNIWVCSDEIGATNGIIKNGNSLSLLQCPNGSVLRVGDNGSYICSQDQIASETQTGLLSAKDFAIFSNYTKSSVNSITVGSGISNTGTTRDPVLAINAGNGLQINSNILSLIAGDNSIQIDSNGISTKLNLQGGLIKDANGISIRRDCASGEVIKWNGSDWACGTDNSAGSYIAGQGINITGNLISNTGALSVNSLVGNLNLVSNSPDEVIITDNGTDTITIALPQGIATNSSPTFTGITIGNLNGILKASSGVVSDGTTTDDLPEGITNLYYTDTRTRNALSASGLIFYNNLTGDFSLSSIDLNTDTTGILPISKGGTGISTTPSANSVLIGDGLGGYGLSTLTAGTNINITNNSGILTINSTGVAGTTNYISKFTSASSIGDSLIFDNGTSVGIGTVTPISQFNVAGKIVAGISQLPSTYLAGIYTQGHYAYVAKLGFTIGTGSFGIYDISNPAAIVEVGSLPSGSIPEAREVYVQGDYAYVVSASQANHQLYIIDVKNPSNPSIVSTTPLTSGGATVSYPHIYVQGKYAYVAHYDGAQVTIFDISNPVSPIEVTNTALTDPRAISVQGSYAYIIEKNLDEINVYDISDPNAAPGFLGSSNIGLDSPDGIFVQGKYAYVTSENNGKLVIFDITDPSSPTNVGELTGLTGPVKNPYVQGRYAYVIASNNTFNIIDISNPTAPTLFQSMATSTNDPQGISVQGRYAYITSGFGQSLDAYDIGGSYIQQFEAGGIDTGTLSVKNNFFAVDGVFNGGVTIGQSLNVKGNLHAKDLTVEHIEARGGTPTATNGIGAGTGAAVSTIGSDTAGEINLTTGTGTMMNQPIVTLTFNKPYTTQPFVVITNVGLNGGSINYITVNTTSFTIYVNTIGLTDGTNYKWHYHVIQ